MDIIHEFSCFKLFPLFVVVCFVGGTGCIIQWIDTGLMKVMCACACVRVFVRVHACAHALVYVCVCGGGGGGGA